MIPVQGFDVGRGKRKEFSGKRKPRDEMKPRSRWQIFKKKRREGLQSISERIYWRSEEGLT